jgi:hypothetical protein
MPSLSDKELLKIEKNKANALQIQLDKALDRLKLLQRHLVYGFWTSDGRLFYAGQDTDEGTTRIKDHLRLATGNSTTGVSLTFKIYFPIFRAKISMTSWPNS